MKPIRRWLPAAALAVVTTAFAAGAPIAGYPPKPARADLVLRDAAIATLDPLQPHAQAEYRVLPHQTASQGTP